MCVLFFGKLTESSQEIAGKGVAVARLGLVACVSPGLPRARRGGDGERLSSSSSGPSSPLLVLNVRHRLEPGLGPLGLQAAHDPLEAQGRLHRLRHRVPRLASSGLVEGEVGGPLGVLLAPGAAAHGRRRRQAGRVAALGRAQEVGRAGACLRDSRYFRRRRRCLREARRCTVRFTSG